MNYILVGLYGRPSMRAVKAQMEIPVTIKYLKRESCRFDENDVVIRWGTTSNNVRFNGAKRFNSGIAIRLAQNKRDSRKKLQDCGVPCPKTYFDIGSNIPLGTKVIARPSHHRRGENFHILTIGTRITEGMFGTDYYYSEVFDKTNEYRVHVGHGKVIAITEKPISTTDLRANQHITNLSWRYLKWHEYKKSICRASCDAIKCIGLDCGAVDIMYNSHTGKCAVCEINTAPTINDSEYLTKRYAKYFGWIFNHPNKPHWDYTRYTIGKSFAWTNNQLRGE